MIINVLFYLTLILWSAFFVATITCICIPKTRFIDFSIWLLLMNFMSLLLIIIAFVN